MALRFNKDAWIRDAIKRRYLIPQRDGTILRCIKADDKGNLLSEIYREVVVQTHKRSGRAYFNLTWRGFTKSVLVNRVVAWAFLPNPHNLPQVDHRDGVKANNAVWNLEWVTSAENERRAHRTGLKTGRGSSNSNAVLTAEQVEEIRASSEKPADLARRFGVSRSTIANIISGRSWRHI